MKNELLVTTIEAGWKPALLGCGLLASIVLASLAGCSVGPDYKRPAVDAPGAFRRAASDTNNAPPSTDSFADVGWWETFKDPRLTAYISEALTNSWDVKIAAA